MNVTPPLILYHAEEVPAAWRVVLVAGIALLSLGVAKVLNITALIPDVLFIPACSLGLFGLLFLARQSLTFPTLPFLSVFFIFMAVFIDSFSARSFGISPKANQLFFLLSVCAAPVYFIRDWKYFWSHRQVQLAILFFLITLVYFFFHASDFDISRVKYGYVLLIMSGLEINSPPVRVIILTSSTGILISHLLAVAPFRNIQANQPQLEKLLKLTYGLTAFSLLLIIFCTLSKGAKMNYGMQCYMPLIMMAALAFLYFVRKYHAAKRAWLFPCRLSTLLNASLIISGAFLMLILNKTSLISTLLVFVLFFWITRHCGYDELPKQIWRFASQDILTKLLLACGFVAMLILGATFGIFELFTSKIDYVISGIINSSSMKVREGNWQYFIHYWRLTLDLPHVLFGYGIGASRKAIFFISAMRDNANESNLVQTVHNTYIEYLYDYGCLCLVYFGMYVVFLKKCLQSLFKPENQDRLVASAAQLSIILFTGIYGLTDGIRVQMLIQVFVLLGFLEGLKRYYATVPQAATALAVSPESTRKSEPCFHSTAGM